jgi:hypothetical protein
MRIFNTTILALLILTTTSFVYGQSVAFAIPAEHSIIVGDYGYGLTLQSAITAIGSTLATLVVPSGTYSISEDLTIPTNITLKLDKMAVIKVLTPPPIQTVGSGLSDVTPGGPCSTTARDVYSFKISTAAGTDKFQWKVNSGSWSTEVPISGSAQTIERGLTVTWGATTGHTLGDTWTVTPTTLTINGGLEAGLVQIFSCTGTGKVFLGPGAVKEVYPQWWGATGNGVADDTLACQAALTTGKDVFFPDGAYMINTIRIKQVDGGKYGLAASSIQNITLASGATLKAITNSSDAYAVLGIFDVDRVKVSGGTIQGERLTHTGSTSEHGHCISVKGSTNVTIEDVCLRDAWGDGLYLGKGTPSGTKCAYVTTRKLVVDNCRRNGLSIVYCDNYVDFGSTFKNTNGTLPEAGVDVEPDHVTDTQENIIFNGSKFINNAGYGLDVLGGSSGTQYSHGVMAIGCESSNNARGCYVYKDAELTWIGGEIKNNRIMSAGLEGDTPKLTIDKTHITGTPKQAHILFNGFGSANRRFTIQNSTLELSGVSNFFISTNADVSSILNIENNDFHVSAAIRTDYLRGSKVTYRGNRYFVKTGYANNNNSGILLTNIPFTVYIDCEFNNDTTIRYVVGATNSKNQNCTFGPYVTFAGSL